MVPPRIVYASQIDVTECADPPRGHQERHDSKTERWNANYISEYWAKSQAASAPSWPTCGTVGQPWAGTIAFSRAVCTASTALSTLSSPSLVRGRSRTA